MTLTPTDLAKLAGIVIFAIIMAYQDDPRVGAWIRKTWSSTVGAWFARRRVVGRFTERRRARIRVGAPDEHSAGIMATRRDVNCGSWS